MAKLRSYCSSWHAKWPEPDRSSWQAAMSPGDCFDPPGKGANWTPPSRQNVERAYNRYLDTLRRHGHLGPVQSVADRYSMDMLRAFHQDASKDVRPITAWAYLQALSRAFAVMAPELDRRDLHRVLSRLKARISLARSFAEPLPTPVDLIAIGRKLMSEADAMTLGFKAAIRYRNGAIIVSAAHVPLRRANWAVARLGRHLIVSADAMALHICESDTKSRRDPIELTLPYEVDACIRSYLHKYRPVLLKSDKEHDHALWLSQTGETMSVGGFGLAISKTLSNQLGRPFSFHMFRHAAATFVADVAPDQSKLIAGLLTHSGLSIAEEHYVRGQRRAAVGQYQKLVGDLVTKQGR